jgi:hypothetical protein
MLILLHISCVCMLVYLTMLCQFAKVININDRCVQ